MQADLANLTAADFEPRLTDDFRLPASAGETTVKLIEVRRLGQAARPGGAFSLLSLAPRGPFLAQAIYPLTHPTLGTLDVFLVPLGPRDGGNCYEAVFT